MANDHVLEKKKAEETPDPGMLEGQDHDELKLRETRSKASSSRNETSESSHYS